MLIALGPESLITPRAPVPGGVDSAQMVSCGDAYSMCQKYPFRLDNTGQNSIFGRQRKQIT